MQQVGNRSVLKKAATTVLGGLLACLLLFSIIAAVNPGLHQCLHPDAGGPSHICVISLLANGQFHTADSTTVFCVMIAAVLFLLPSFKAPAPCREWDRLSSGRGPPSR